MYEPTRSYWTLLGGGVEAGLTQEDLADEARMTINCASLVELGQTHVTVSAATRMARALQVKRSKILADVEE